jgi:hypothetical protein
MHRLKPLKRLPSPALIVSLVALFAALGGTSYAALSANTVNSRTIQNGTIRNEDFKDGTLRGAEFKRDSLGGGAIKEEALDATKIANVRSATRATTADSAASADRATVAAGITRQVAVSSDGTRALDRGGVVSVTKTATGRYQVIFDADVRACLPSATLQIENPPAGRTDVPVTGEIAVAPLAGNVNGIQVATADSAGAASDRGFVLLVSC